EIDSADANNETLYVVRIRKSLIASGSDANTSDAASEEVRERIVRLHPTTTIGENPQGDFLLLLTSGQAADEGASPIDTVWFAVPVSQ
ncbi:MAG: hypothetical protein RLY14_2986, partial [Planctomycetota bacterium]